MSIIIEYDEIAPNNRAIKKLAQAFTRAGTPVVSIDVSAKSKRSSGVNYREVYLTYADSQKITLAIKQTGDIFQVKLNGSVVALKEQTDQIKAVAEISKMLDAGRSKFQQKMARIKTVLPKGIKTAAPRMEVVLKEKLQSLDAEIVQARSEVNSLREELGEPVMDAVSGGFMAFNIDSALGKFTAYVKADATITEKEAKSDAGELARADLGGRSVTVVGSGKRVKAIPKDAWESKNAKGWGWLTKGYLESALDAVGHQWHTDTMKAMKIKSDDSLRYIYKDANEAAEIGEKNGNPKSGQYRDEAHYAAMELERRRKLRSGNALITAFTKAIKSSNNGKLLVANVPDDIRFAVDELLKAGKIVKADFDRNAAIKLPDSANKALDSARKNNQKGYAFYVVVGDKIESGWEYDDDAKEHKAENMPTKFKSSAKIMKKAALKAKGIDPDDNESWLGSDALDSASDTAYALRIANRINGGAVLDSADLGHSTATLQAALDVLRNNYPISLREGRSEQAELQRSAAESIERALGILGSPVAQSDRVSTLQRTLGMGQEGEWSESRNIKLLDNVDESEDGQDESFEGAETADYEHEISENQEALF